MNRIFDQTLRLYGINASELARRCDVSPAHVSKFRVGKGNITTEILEKLLTEMNAIAPGSRGYFCSLLAGETLEIKEQVRYLPSEEIAQILSVISERMASPEKQLKPVVTL